ncbi:MAG TPA: DinB family protein [Chitinophagaceae bacterium]|nr:DinB family protein [Chitinophagaceae bacterium]
MKSQLLEAWQIHQGMNLLLIENISDAGMEKTLSSRGRTVFQQWAHLHNVRIQWLKVSAADLASGCKPIDKKDPFNRKGLIGALSLSAEAVGEFFARSWEEGGKVRGFKKGLMPFFAYLVSHESHHRGSILLTLKQTGEMVPDRVKWAIWEWSS